jgi:hypothetical protein
MKIYFLLVGFGVFLAVNCLMVLPWLFTYPNDVTVALGVFDFVMTVPISCKYVNWVFDLIYGDKK